MEDVHTTGNKVEIKVDDPRNSCNFRDDDGGGSPLMASTFSNGCMPAAKTRWPRGVYTGRQQFPEMFPDQFAGRQAFAGLATKMVKSMFWLLSRWWLAAGRSRGGCC